MDADINLTSKEKILVYLLEYYGKNDSYALPVGITQEGIAEEVGLKQNTVSYAVRNLVKEELVTEETRRIKGKKQKRKAYFLTEEAVDKAQELKEKISNTPVEVKIDGKNKEIKIGDINTYFHLNLSLIEIVKRIEQGESFDRERKKEQRSFEAHFSKMPTHPNESIPEVDELLEWVGEEKSLALVVGEDGHGKTTVLSKFAEEMQEETNVFYFKVEEWHSSMHFWTTLSQFLERIGRHRLSSYLQASEEQNENEIFTNLREDLSTVNFLFLIDDIDKNRDLQESIKSISELESTPLMKMVASSESGDEVSTHIEDSWIVRLESIQPIYESLKYYYGVEKEKDLIENVVGEHLTKGEFIALAFISILRAPANKDKLSMLEEVNTNIVDSLLQTPFMSLTMNDMIAIHPWVKKRVLALLEGDKIKELYDFEEEKVKKLHEKAYQYYSGHPISDHIEEIEELYHLANAEKFELFEERADKIGEKLLSSGFSSALVDVIGDYKRGKKDPDMVPPIRFLEAEAHRKMEKIDFSLEGYRRTIEHTEDPELETKSHHGIAKIKEDEGKYEEAIEEYQRSIEAGEKIKGEKEKRRILGISYLRLGSTLDKKREYEEAKENLIRAIDVLGKDDNSLLTSAYFILARIEKSIGESDEAVEHFQTGLDHWEEIDETYQMVGGMKEIGALYTILRELDDAEEHLREAVDISERFGYWRLKSSALLSLSECYMERGKIDAAVESALEAKELLDTLGEDEDKAFAHTLLSKGYGMKQEEEKAEEELNQAISIFQRLGSSYRLGLAYFSLAKLQERQGNKEGLAENYRKAVLSFSGGGADGMAEKVEKEMESIPLSM